MLGNIFPPFTTMQECNLDWILTKVKNILRFVPDDGQVGQILRRTRSGAEWSDEQGGGGAVTSVNGQTGTVVLTAADVGALPDSTIIPTNTSDLNNDSGFVDAAGAAAAAPVQSVNGQTGAVTLSIPTNTSDLNNDSGFITAGQAPVQSVNGQTGTVILGKSDVGLGNVDNVQQYSASNPPPYPVTSVNGQTGAVTVPAITKEALVVTAVNQANINVNAYKSGYTVLVTGINAVYPYAITADTKIAQISESPATQAFGIGKTLSGNDVFVFVNTNGELFVSGLTPVPASQNMYFSLVYFTP